MGNKSSKAPVKAVSVWFCETCEDKAEMTHAEMLEHMKVKHSVETKGLMGKRSLQMHLDCADSYHSTWLWTFEFCGREFKLTNGTCNPRHKGDYMQDCC